MVNSINEAMDGIDALIVMLDVTAIGPHDRTIVQEMGGKNVFKLLVLNKTDLKEPKDLLAVIDEFRSAGYDAILPVSAKTGDGMDELVKELTDHLPEGPKYFPDDMLTDQPERVLVSEIIREKALRNLEDEIPHGVGVEILQIHKLSENLTEIHANVYCERAAHKSVIIGKQGSMLGLIGSQARADIEKMLGTKVMLRLWVKVREDWRNRKEDLRNLGYVNEE